MLLNIIILSSLLIPWRELTIMSKLSQMSYGYRKYIEPTTVEYEQKEVLVADHKPESNVITFIENDKDLECIIYKNIKEKKYTIIFRGTESQEDWKNNLNILKLELNDGIKVHRGYYNQLMYNNSYDTIKEVVHKCNKKNFEWWLTGHSSGGSLAIMCSYLLSQDFKDKNFSVVSLANPKVGGSLFAKTYDKITNIVCWRVVYDKDVVPMMPPMGYKHVGDLIKLVPKHKKKRRITHIILNHHINNYVAGLMRISNPNKTIF